jgi:serine/threonine-protein kinase
MAWLIVAFLTTLVGLAAVNSLGDGILGSAERPLTHESVEAQLSSSAPAPTSAPSPSPVATPSVEAVAHTFSSAGGTVTAACDGDLVTLKYWSPAQGYEADHVAPGPGPSASIRFRQGGRGHGIRLAFGCANGAPIQSANTSDEG